MAVDGLALRFASAADADALAGFSQATYAAAFGLHFQPGDLGAHLEAELSVVRWRAHLARDRVLLAETGGELVGYLQFGPAEGRAGLEIRRAYVAADRLGQGIGSRLLAAAFQISEMQSASAVWIEVWEDNPGARRLYKRFGFVETGERGEDFVTASGEMSPGDLILVRRASH